MLKLLNKLLIPTTFPNSVLTENYVSRTDMATDWLGENTTTTTNKESTNINTMPACINCMIQNGN